MATPTPPMRSKRASGLVGMSRGLIKSGLTSCSPSPGRATDAPSATAAGRRSRSWSTRCKRSWCRACCGEDHGKYPQAFWGQPLSGGKAGAYGDDLLQRHRRKGTGCCLSEGEVLKAVDSGVDEAGRHKSKSDGFSKVGSARRRRTLLRIVTTLIKNAQEGDLVYHFMARKYTIFAIFQQNCSRIAAGGGGFAYPEIPLCFFDKSVLCFGL